MQSEWWKFYVEYCDLMDDVFIYEGFNCDIASIRTVHLTDAQVVMLAMFRRIAAPVTCRSFMGERECVCYACLRALSKCSARKRIERDTAKSAMHSASGISRMNPRVAVSCMMIASLSRYDADGRAVALAFAKFLRHARARGGGAFSAMRWAAGMVVRKVGATRKCRCRAAMELRARALAVEAAIMHQAVEGARRLLRAPLTSKSRPPGCA